MLSWKGIKNCPFPLDIASLRELQLNSGLCTLPSSPRFSSPRLALLLPAGSCSLLSLGRDR